MNDGARSAPCGQRGTESGDVCGYVSLYVCVCARATVGCMFVLVCLCERDFLRDTSEDSHSMVPSHLREGGGNDSDILEFRSI